MPPRPPMPPRPRPPFPGGSRQLITEEKMYKRDGLFRSDFGTQGTLL